MVKQKFLIMKIVYSPGGQLCNKMWSFVHFVAQAFKQNEKVYFLNFGEYMHLFPNLREYKNIRFIKINNKYIHLLILNFCRLIKKISNSVIDGWQYRSDPKLLNEFFDKIQNLFSPHLYVKQKCEKLITELKNKGVVVVGIHIRRGDYAQFMNGVYYFENDIYIHYMKQIQKAIAKEVCFFISSAEQITFDDMDITYFQIPQANSIEDLYALSLCDYILGPPSTFSMWASFYGKTPLKIVAHKNESIHLTDFKIITAIDTFQDGTVFSHV